MTVKSFLDDRLHDYLLSVSLREPEVLKDLRAETVQRPGAQMQIAPEQGQFMALLVRLMGARRVLEIGTFTGYSALVVALALPPDGEVVTCDLDADATAVARCHWERAGVADKIHLRLGPALETLDALLADGQAGRFDFAFIDADKKAYPDYFERSLELLRPGGLVAIDNVLWGGRVTETTDDPRTLAIQQFNERLHRDDRVELSLVPVADGLTLARKRD